MVVEKIILTKVKGSMEMKKINKVLLVAIFLVGGLLLAGCNNKKEEEKKKVEKITEIKLVYSDNEEFKINTVVPADKKEKATYKELKATDKDAKLVSEKAQYGLLGEKVEIDFNYKKYDYRTKAYTKKYKKKTTTNFANFKESIMDKTLNSKLTDVEEIKINEVDGIQYINNGVLVIVLNTDDISTEKYIEITVHALDKEAKVADLVKEKDIKSVIDSIKIEKNIKEEKQA